MQREFKYDPNYANLMYEVEMFDTMVHEFPDLKLHNRVLLKNTDIVHRKDPAKTTSVLLHQVPKSMYVSDKPKGSQPCLKRQPYDIPGVVIPGIYKHIDGKQSEVVSCEVFQRGAWAVFTFGKRGSEGAEPMETRTFGNFTVRTWRTLVYRYDQCENTYLFGVEIEGPGVSEYFFLPIPEIRIGFQPERSNSNPDYSYENQFLHVLEAADAEGDVWGFRKALMSEFLGGCQTQDFPNKTTAKFHRYNDFLKLYRHMEDSMYDGIPTLLTPLFAILLHEVRHQHEDLSLKDAMIGYRADNVVKAWEKIKAMFIRLNPDQASKIKVHPSKALKPGAVPMSAVNEIESD